jgi:hypothetical protein
VDRSDVDRTEVGRADLGRADLGHADVDRADLYRAGADRADSAGDGRGGDTGQVADARAAGAAGWAPSGPDAAGAAAAGTGLAAAGTPPAAAMPTSADDHDQHPLLPGDQGDELRRRWRDVQAGFVDDPRESVRRAGELVGEAVQTVTVRLTEHWQAIGPDRGDAATEELRRALRRYRTLFDRLLDL